MLSHDDVLGYFTNSEALLHGHFLLASGLHSPAYLEKFKVLQHPKYVELLCTEIARRFSDAHIDVVLGPTTGGVLLAYEVGKQLGVRGIFAERDDANKCRVLRRGFEIKPGERVLLVDDILTTGGSVRETVQVVTEHGGTLVGIAVLADRSGKQLDMGAPLTSLLKLDIETYSADNCPLCKQGIPLTKRGTTPGASA
jgi:orotate phosphoribosyltransferase